jgi:hypothetical protein
MVATILGDTVFRDVRFSLISGGESGSHCAVFLFAIKAHKSLGGLNSESITSDSGYKYGLLDNIVVRGEAEGLISGLSSRRYRPSYALQPLFWSVAAIGSVAC